MNPSSSSSESVKVICGYEELVNGSLVEISSSGELVVVMVSASVVVDSLLQLSSVLDAINVTLDVDIDANSGNFTSPTSLMLVRDDTAFVEICDDTVTIIDPSSLIVLVLLQFYFETKQCVSWTCKKARK